MAKMLQKIAFTLMTLIYKVDSYFLPNDDVFAADIKVPLDSATPPPAMKLPEYQRITASDVQLDLFKPDQALKQVPDLLSPVFHPSEAQPPKSSASTYKPVGMLCHLDRIYVRVLKSLFTNPDAYKYLKVGSCAVNQATDQHYYVLYALNGCDGQQQENQDSVIYSNTLRYEPEEPTELVVRELPFSVGLECHYHKHHRSYQLGYYPEVFKETTFVGLKSGASITHVDDSGDVLLPVRSYSIGEPMYFEVKAHSRNTEGKRVYLNKCYISASEDLTATPTYTVLDNYGCLVDGKQNTQSKFYPSTDESTVRFSVASVLFKDLISQPEEKRISGDCQHENGILLTVDLWRLNFKMAAPENYMQIMFIHCEMTLGPQTPTPSAKSCTYDLSTKRWTELLGDNSVCNCCDTSCPAPDSSATMRISSNPWEIE